MTATTMLTIQAIWSELDHIVQRPSKSLTAALNAEHPKQQLSPITSRHGSVVPTGISLEQSQQDTASQLTTMLNSLNQFQANEQERLLIIAYELISTTYIEEIEPNELEQAELLLTLFPGIEACQATSLTFTSSVSLANRQIIPKLEVDPYGELNLYKLPSGETVTSLKILLTLQAEAFLEEHYEEFGQLNPQEIITLYLATKYKYLLNELVKTMDQIRAAGFTNGIGRAQLSASIRAINPDELALIIHRFSPEYRRQLATFLNIFNFPYQLVGYGDVGSQSKLRQIIVTLRVD